MMNDKSEPVVKRDSDGTLATKNAKELAQRLGWDVATGKAAMALGQTMAMVTAADTAGAEVLESTGDQHKAADENVEAMERIASLSPLLSQLMLGQLTAVSGEYRGRSVLLIPVSNPPKAQRQPGSKLNMVMMLPKPLDLHLHIYPESLGSKAGKLFIGLQDLVTGNEELDPLVMIKAQDESGAQRKLDRPATQEALLALFRRRPFSCYPQCNDIALRATVLGEHTVDDLSEVLEALANAADALEQP